MNEKQKKKAISTRTLVQIALICAIFCVISPIAIPIPISPVPITLVNFFIGIFTIVFGYKKTFFGIALFILLGAIGLPVFSGGGGGLSKLLGPTGGYLLGYLLICFFTGIFYEKSNIKSPIIVIIGGIIGTIACYILGTLWLQNVTQTPTFNQALVIGVIPYIPLDIVKIVISSYLGVKLAKYIK